jgi:hypothetical protein
MELEAILEIKQLRYLAQDETRIGRKTETKRVALLHKKYDIGDKSM